MSRTHVQHVWDRVKRPSIITLCGSTRFKDEFVAANLKYTLLGYIVLTIGCDMRTDDEIFGAWPTREIEVTKHRLDVLHLWKIRMADLVLILNKDGYIGESTTRELWYAMRLGKGVDFLEPELRHLTTEKLVAFNQKYELEGDDVIARVGLNLEDTP